MTRPAELSVDPSGTRLPGAAPVGGSNRLLSVEELAAYLGVPKTTVYDRWRQWG